MRDAAFLAFFAAYLPVILRFPHIGAMLWAWAAFFSPNEYLYGFMAPVPLSKLIAVLTLGTLAFAATRRRFYLDPILGCLIALLLLGLASASMSLSGQALNWDLFGKLGKILVLCLVITALMTDRRRLHGLVASVAIGLAFNGVDEGLKFIMSGGGHHIQGVETIGDNNSFALAMVMCLPLLLYLHGNSTHRAARLGFLGGAIICGIAVIGTFSRGGFMGLAALALGIVALNRNKARNLALVGLGVSVLMWLAPPEWFDRIHSIGNAGQDNSFMERVCAWKISTLVALDHPLLGGGFHAIQDTSVWTRYIPQLPRLDFVPSAPPEDEGRAAHSIYFEVLGDLGFAGLFLFLGLLALGLRACSRVRRLARGHADLAWAGDLASMIRLSLIVYMVSGAALSMAYFELLYVMLAMLSVTQRLVSRELARRAATEPAMAAATWALTA